MILRPPKTDKFSVPELHSYCRTCMYAATSLDCHPCDECSTLWRLRESTSLGFPRRYEYSDHAVFTSDIKKYKPSPPHAGRYPYYGTKGPAFAIEKVVFNEPATIVFWDDGTKTVVKCAPNDYWDAEKGLAMACMKKLFGNRGNFNEILKKWCAEDDQYVDAQLSLDEVFRQLVTPFGCDLDDLTEKADDD